MTERVVGAAAAQARARRSGAAFGRYLRDVTARLPTRLRDRRFWIVQCLILVISVAHGLLEARLIPGLPPGLYLAPVSAYFIPVVYAALNFGVEGAVPTALWSAALVAPNLVLWHSPAQRPGVVLEMVILVVIAYVIAQRVDFETAAKERAEAATARLERLNQTAAASAKSLELDTVLSHTLQAMLDPNKQQTGWVLLTVDGTDTEIVHVASASGGPAEIGGPGLAATRSVVAEPAATSHPGAVVEPGLAIVPIRASGRHAGAIGLASPRENLSAADVRLLEAVASQLGVALDNIHHLRKVERTVSELSAAQRALQDYVRLATDAQEDERMRLARELHDGTIQSLAIARAELDSITAVGEPVAASVTERLERVEAVLTTAIDDVRRFSRDLRPSLLDDLGLVDAIDWLVGDLAARTTIDAQLRVTGEARRLGQREELALFRIVQEALRNVERHAHATAVEVRVDFNEDVRATVIDNGVGFETGDALGDRRAATGLGLLGMRERAKLAGATLAIKSDPRFGTEVVVVLAPAG